MLTLRRPAVQTFAILLAIISLPVVQADDIQLLETIAVPGDAVDMSGLADMLEGGVPHHQLGGFSAIAYTGSGNRYIALPDRGPSDGAVPYLCRFHEIELTVNPLADAPLVFQLKATHMLRDASGQSFNGSAKSINHEHPEKSLRFDPEGVRVGADGTVYIVDEYGPALSAFSPQGKLLRRFSVPEHLQVRNPAADSEEEIASNSRGRQTNRGFEGLAISPDGRRLYAILQGPLLQDQPFDDAGERLGKNVRMMEFDVDNGSTREFVYVLDKASFGISEVLMLDDQRLLILERDGKPGSHAKSKRLYEASLQGATDISGLASLPAGSLPAGIRSMPKRLFLDLLDPQFGIAEQIPEKVEGICFGPNLADGRRLLLVCTDNDFIAANPGMIYAFAVPSETDSSFARLAAESKLSMRAQLATGPIPPAADVTQVDEMTIRRGVSLYDGDSPRNPDGTFNVVVEIPAGTNAKWEVSKTGEMIWEVRKGEPRIVQFLPYPGNYGMIPGTLLSKDDGGDGDALDVLVLGPAVPRGSVIAVHVIGLMKFLDDGEQDDKILAVMLDTPLAKVRNLADLDQSFQGASEIVNRWFTSYKGPGGRMDFRGWGDADEAIKLIQRGIHTHSGQ